MFHMLTCFNLHPDTSIEAFSADLDALSAHLKDRDLLHETGPIGRRQRHPIMDTDEERDHEYFFVMTFLDRAQCDRSVDYVTPNDEPVESLHIAVNTKVVDAIFICWEDL